MSRFELIAVYIMASKRNGTLYLGVTGNLPQRAHQHRERKIEGFSQKYGCKLLVWYEQYEEIGAAIAREKELKKWRRAWKLALIDQPAMARSLRRLHQPTAANIPRLAPSHFVILALRTPFVIPGLRAAKNPEPRDHVAVRLPLASGPTLRVSRNVE